MSRYGWISYPWWRGRPTMEAADASVTGDQGQHAITVARFAGVWLPMGMRGRALTEDCSGRIVTGKTGLAHTRTAKQSAQSNPSHSALAPCCGVVGGGLGRGAGVADNPTTGMTTVQIRGSSPIVDDESRDYANRCQQGSLRWTAHSWSPSRQELALARPPLTFLFHVDGLDRV